MLQKEKEEKKGEASMNENYELFGLDENATDEELKNRYSELKKKYNEERWLEGEAGNEAARMLGKLDAAYLEIMTERREKGRQQSHADNILREVADEIKAGDLTGAQKLLDDCNERSAEWHYLQSVLFYRKSWMNESKKQLEIAINMDPNNAKYKDAYDRLKNRMNYREQSAYSSQGQSVHPENDSQMGGNGCSQCLECCYTYLCVNCIFNICCNCR
jgi:molecular chaperone DnaJ